MKILQFVACLIFSVIQFLYAQEMYTLTCEQEEEIKLSGKYYWGEASDSDIILARISAIEDLKIYIQRTVNDVERKKTIFNFIDMESNIGLLNQKGKKKVLAWIEKYRDTETRFMPEENTFVPQEEISSNTILFELAVCKNYTQVRRFAMLKGFVRAGNINSIEGFPDPSKCIIAVFKKDGSLYALLDKGKDVRVDLISGNKILHPEMYYDKDQYFFWYMLQR